MLIPIGYYLALLFLLGPVALYTSKRLGKWAGWIYAIVPLYGVISFLSVLPEVDQGFEFTESYSWLPQYGINFSIYVDGLSVFFSMLVLGIGALILIYAAYYAKAYPRKEIFMGHLILFMAAMFGVVVAGNLLTLFLFWELTAIFSYLLIGFDHEKYEARWGALQALLITGLGGQALLAGFVLMGITYQNHEFTAIFNNPELLKSSSVYLPVLILVCIGAFTKSAQFPFHFWLPDAMVAPTPVSAYLHSATMVKAGIFLLLRFNLVLGGTESWHYILTIFGVTTMFLGAWSSITQTDIKRVLAYATISALGTLVLLVGTDTEYAINAAIIFILVHALYKGSLFMLAGIIQKQTGTREIPKLGGLFKYMPFIGLVMSLALVSMAGVPPMLGFISKELVYEAKVHAPSAYGFILSAGIFANVVMVFLSLRLFLDIFTGKKGDYSSNPKRPGLSMVLGPFFLVMMSLILGLFPETFANALTAQAIKDINPDFGVIKLHLWPGWNLVQLISILTVLAGILMYIKKDQVISFANKTDLKYFTKKFSSLFNSFIENFLTFTKGKTKKIQHGYHRFYIMTVFAVGSILVWFHVWHADPITITLNFKDIPIADSSLIVLLIVATFTAVSAKSRTITLIAMGVIGFGITLIFIVFSGVDLPITMILAEVMTIIFSLALLFYLPKYVNKSRQGERMRDAFIANLVGTSMCILVMQAVAVELGKPMANFFKEASLKEAFGKNIVNVVLVDFRAFDTLGEITVLAIAAIGIFSLLVYGDRMKKMTKESEILRIAAKMMYPLLLGLSVVVLLRGHQEPGGGFIGGLMVGAAYILYAMAYGVKETRRKYFLQPLHLMGLGLLIAVLSGLPGVIGGGPYMKGEWWELISGIKLGTPVIFDLGVYLTVAGMLTQVMDSIMEE